MMEPSQRAVGPDWMCKVEKGTGLALADLCAPLDVAAGCSEACCCGTLSQAEWQRFLALLCLL